MSEARRLSADRGLLSGWFESGSGNRRRRSGGEPRAGAARKAGPARQGNRTAGFGGCGVQIEGRSRDHDAAKERSRFGEDQGSGLDKSLANRRHQGADRAPPGQTRNATGIRHHHRLIVTLLRDGRGGPIVERMCGAFDRGLRSGWFVNGFCNRLRQSSAETRAGSARGSGRAS
jgi:hypothetical protein